jgi:DNA sulfur modification protein DndB
MPIGEIRGGLKRKVDNQTYYFGTVSSDKIRSFTFVPVIERSSKTYLEERDEGGYQRPGSRSRMRIFMRYLAESPACVVPPVLLSGRDGWRFTQVGEDPGYGNLMIEKPAAIIDGQHRVGGYIALFEEKVEVRPVDFILLEGLTREQEVDQFVTVNSTQKGVPKALNVFLGQTEPAQIAWALNEEMDSPFKGRISRTTVGRDHLFALHSIAKNVERTFNHGKFHDLDEDTKIEYLIRYWTIIADEYATEWADIEKLEDLESRGRNDFEHKLLELTGFICWSLIAPEILGRSYIEGIGMHWDNVASLVRAAGAVDWRKDGQYAGRTGEAGARVIFADMQRLLPAATTVLD